jgi:hypothetical protein
MALLQEQNAPIGCAVFGAALTRRAEATPHDNTWNLIR